jgi:hypothetical protein
MNPEELIQNAIQALEALKGVPDMDPTIIDQCIQAVQEQNTGEGGQGEPAGPEMPGAPPPPSPPPQEQPSSLADANQLVKDHLSRTGELPTTGRRGKHLYKRRGQGKGTAR